MTSLEFTQKLQAFAKDGGGEIFTVAVTAEPKRAGYTFNHWSGLFTTEWGKPGQGSENFKAAAMKLLKKP